MIKLCCVPHILLMSSCRDGQAGGAPGIFSFLMLPTFCFIWETMSLTITTCFPLPFLFFTYTTKSYWEMNGAMCLAKNPWLYVTKYR